MSIGATFTQLVLFDGININDREWSVKVNGLSNIPSSCNFWIFCRVVDTVIEESLKTVKNPKVRLYKSADPVIHIFDTLYDTRFTYSFILVVCDKNASYARNLNRITKKNTNICVMQMNPNNVSVKDILHYVDCQRVKAPLCSTDDLLQHTENKHDTEKNEHHRQVDHLWKVLHNKNSRSDNQCKKGLCCLVCDTIFHKREDQYEHIKEGHPDATSDDDHDDHDDY